MTLKKESFFNRFLIELIIIFSKILNLFDFKIRTLFILLNIVVSSFFLMVYVKPYLDDKFIKEEVSNLAIKEVKSVPEVIVITTPETLPLKKVSLSTVPSIAARSFIIYDLKNNKEILQENKLETLPPASLVKMLSVMFFYQKLDLSKKYNAVPECNNVEGQKVGYKKGEKVTGKDLLFSSLIFSAGDSICNMYKITESDLDGFNNYAKDLGMINSNFTNFIGLDYPGNYTTADDLLKMTLKFIENPLFNEIVILKSYQMENGKTVYNTNKMLFENNYSIGIKTGTTYGAKENLIYRYKNDEKDLDILVILLNSGSRYQDTRNILNQLN